MSPEVRRIVAATLVAQAVAIGTTIGAFSLFVRPLADAFAASTLQVSAGLSLITMMLGICGIPIGMWLDRGSPRRIMVTGCAIMATALVLASCATALWQLALACILCGSGVPMLGPVTTAAVVGKAAPPALRGRALGLANLGVPLGGLAFALIGAFAIDAWGWRVALRLFALLAVVCVLPAVSLAIPADRVGHAAPTSRDGREEVAWTPARLLRSPAFRLAALALGVGMGTTAGWVAHLAPFLQDLGASTRYAGVVVGATQGLALVGTLTLGALADRRGSVGILVGILAVQASCFALLYAGPGLGAASAAAIVAGMVSGGVLPVYGHLLAERFGAGALGRAMGLSNVALLPFGFGLPILGGALRDATGSYQSMLAVCAGLLCVGIGVLALLRGRRIAA